MVKIFIAILSALLTVDSAVARNPLGAAAGGTFQGCAGGPSLTPGVWTNITPPVSGISSTYGTTHLAIDPSSHGVLYETVDTLGLWKSTNCGASWVLLGRPPAVFPSPSNGYTTPYLDSPIEVVVDPGDSTHLVATQGVRGTALGFWVSHNSGATWTMPTAFYKLSNSTTTNDVTQFAVDPTNFNHIILGSHSPWPGYSSSGIMETTDGGNSWAVHPPVSSWTPNTHAVNFLYNPASGQGNSNTWLVGDTGGDGMWRTADGGKTWTQVTTYNAVHAGGELFYTPSGTIFTGSTPYPIYSTDNGLTWSQVNKTGLSYFYYYAVVGDGTTLYTMPSNAQQGPAITGPYLVTPESTGTTSAWTGYQGGAQTFTNGPYQLLFDSTNGLMYSGNWNVGLWVLKVIP
jgi:hypothetical protein